MVSLTKRPPISPEDRARMERAFHSYKACSHRVRASRHELALDETTLKELEVEYVKVKGDIEQKYKLEGNYVFDVKTGEHEERPSGIEEKTPLPDEDEPPPVTNREGKVT